MPRSHIPAYRLHSTGQGVVRLDGRDIYLGKHGTAESRERYNRVVAEWLAGKNDQPNPHAAAVLTLTQLAAHYLTHCEVYYRHPDGTPTGQYREEKYGSEVVLKLYGSEPVQDFGPKKLSVCRDVLIRSGLGRTTVNRRVAAAKRMFRWGVAQELVPASVFEALRALPGLRAGRTTAPEPTPVVPVTAKVVDAALAHMPPQIRAMVELQRLTGMRPGEVCLIRPGDVDRTEAVWVYRPASHKTAHHGQSRTIYLGPKAQAVLSPFLLRAATVYCFSPAESRAWFQANRRAERKTPLRKTEQPRVANPQRQPGPRYNTDSYDKAIRRACRKAGVAEWSANQLRHSFATEVRKLHGLEASQVLLGHKRADVTQVYAERDQTLATRIASEAG